MTDFMNRIKLFKFFLALSLSFLSLEIWSANPSESQTFDLKPLIEKAGRYDAKALYQLAKLYDIGYDTIPVDSVKSTALYLLSATNGYAPAMNFIGFRYYKGEYIRQDIDSALYWIQSAADKGDITAAANLGYLLTEGDNIPHNKEKAVKWLTVASEAGVKEAQRKLVELMRPKWELLTNDSILALGIKYYTGRAPIMGTELLAIAADKNIPKAQALLGDAYSKGLGVPYDHQKSIEYFYEAAIGGNPSSQYIIAELLEFFPDIFDNRNEGNKDAISPEFWYSKAAEGGVSDSETAYKFLLSFP